MSEAAAVRAAEILAQAGGAGPRPHIPSWPHFSTGKGVERSSPRPWPGSRCRLTRPSSRCESVYALGRADPALVAALSRAAGISTESKPLTPGELNQLVAEVAAKGDPARGELIFRRPDLNCMSCHSLSKAGGDVGPDLSSLGQTSPPDYIINSILNPDQAIKEQYHTLLVLTTARPGVPGHRHRQGRPADRAQGGHRSASGRARRHDRRPEAGWLARCPKGWRT